jgi:hypothetical protein
VLLLFVVVVIVKWKVAVPNVAIHIFENKPVHHFAYKETRLGRTVPTELKGGLAIVRTRVVRGSRL